MGKLLVVEENPLLREELARVFRGSGHEAVLEAEPRNALVVLKDSDDFELVVCDMLLSDMVGRFFLEAVRRIAPGLPVLVATAYPELIQAQAVESFVTVRLHKPFRSEELLEAVDRALGKAGGETREKRGHSTRRLRRKRDQLEVLLEISRLMGQERDQDRLLKLIVELTALVLRADRATVFILDPVRQELWSKVAIGLPEERTIRFPAGSGLAGWVVDRKEAVISSDPYRDERFNRKVDEDTGYVTRNLLAVPMINLQGEAIGAFEVLNRFEGDFDEEDLSLLSAIAITSAVAFENAKLHEAKNRKVQELRAALTRLRETREELVRTERLATVGRMASGIAHEIRNQLVVLDFMDLIQKRYPDDEKIRYYVKHLVEARNRILHIFDELSDLTQDQAYPMEAEDLGAITRDVADFMQFDAEVRRKGVTVESEPGVTAVVGRDRLKQVVINLLRNAAQHTPEGRPGVEVRVRKADGRALIEVKDHGEGIPAENLARIFQPFFTTKRQTGMGLGLDICRRIIERHHGQLIVKSNPGEGSTFTVSLPGAGG